jgi:hypothetical protein
MLSYFISSDYSDIVLVFYGMPLFRKEAFFRVFILFESDVTVMNVAFLFGTFVVALSSKQFNIFYFTELTEIICDLLFCEALW